MAELTERHDDGRGGSPVKWALAVVFTLVAIAALYVLSIGPAIYIYQLMGEPRWFAASAEVFYDPLEYLATGDTLVGRWLGAYVDWWDGLAT